VALIAWCHEQFEVAMATQQFALSQNCSRFVGFNIFIRV